MKLHHKGEPMSPKQPNSMTPYRTLKVPEWAYDNLVKARQELARRGIQQLPAEFSQPSNLCPVCGGEARVVEATIRYKYLQCGSCGYAQQEMEGSTQFLLGALVGLGAGLVLSSLMSEEEGRRKSTKRKRG